MPDTCESDHRYHCIHPPPGSLSWHPPGIDISMDGLYWRDTGKIPAC